MDYKEKQDFIADLCNMVRDHILGKVSGMPEEWNGIELRQYIADRFAEQAYYLQRKENHKRRRSYKDEVNRLEL